MKTWISLFLIFLLGGVTNAASSKPSLKVVCNVLAADMTLVVHLPDGDKSAKVGTAPIPLKKGLHYTLFISKSGYLPYKKSFYAEWEGQKEKSVVLEKGIGPDIGKPWIVDLEDSVSMELVPIPTGSFMMGSNEGEDDEQPVHKVSFSTPFWMAKTEITNQQYSQFKAINHKPESNEIEMPTGAEYPACWISWNDAQGFCKWLTKKERRKGKLPEGYEYTLPTEAEWEYACRAGSKGEFAGKLDSMGWYNKNSSKRINPVGTKNPNAWGLYDMHGNVWEWCADNWYANYKNAPTDGSQRGLANDEYHVDRSQMGEEGNIYRLYNPDYRVVRGGSWHYSARACRSANRYYHKPDYKLNYLGFRPILIWNPPTLRLQVTEHLKGIK